MELRELIAEYFREAPILSLATVQGGLPWASTVYYAYDPGLNLYFISKVSRRHSGDINENPKVAGTVCRPHPSPFEVPCRGIQLEGSADEMDDPEEIEKALALYMVRFPHSTRYHSKVSDVSGDADKRLYKIVPSRIVLFDEANFPDHPRQELLMSTAVPPADPVRTGTGEGASYDSE